MPASFSEKERTANMRKVGVIRGKDIIIVAETSKLRSLGRIMREGEIPGIPILASNKEIENLPLIKVGHFNGLTLYVPIVMGHEDESERAAEILANKIESLSRKRRGRLTALDS